MDITKNGSDENEVNEAIRKYDDDKRLLMLIMNVGMILIQTGIQ